MPPTLAFPDTSPLEHAGFTCVAAPADAILLAEEVWTKQMGTGLVARISVARGQAKLAILKPEVLRGFRIGWYCTHPAVMLALAEFQRIERLAEKGRVYLGEYPEIVLNDVLDDPFAGSFAL